MTAAINDKATRSPLQIPLAAVAALLLQFGREILNPQLESSK